MLLVKEPDPRQADLDLVRRAAAGETDAFDRLYSAHVGRVYAVCLRMAADVAEAERFTQDVFVKFWQALPSIRGDSRIATWLHRVAVNVVLNDRRGARRREARVAQVEDPGVLPGAVVEQRGGAEERLALENAIQTLPAGARAVLLLHDVEGYTHEEIGEMCGIAAGTAKAQLHRARRLLRERLER